MQATVGAIRDDDRDAWFNWAECGRIDALARLADQGMPVDVREPLYQETALLRVCAVAHLQPQTRFQTAAWLIAHGADPNAVNDGGATPIYLAAGRASDDQDLRLTDLLLRHGADPSQVDWQHLGTRQTMDRLSTQIARQPTQMHAYADALVTGLAAGGPAAAWAAPLLAGIREQSAQPGSA